MSPQELLELAPLAGLVVPVLLAALWLLGMLVGLWLLAAVGLWWGARRLALDGSAREALALLPDVLRLVRALAADATLPRGVRVRLALLVLYLLSPVDLVPDVVPVLGYLDDVVVVALVLRSVVRVAGTGALERHWTGSTDGLASVRRLSGLA